MTKKSSEPHAKMSAESQEKVQEPAREMKDEKIPLAELHQTRDVSEKVTESRELLGKQMSANLIAIAELINKPIPQMQVDEHGVFHEVKSN